MMLYDAYGLAGASSLFLVAAGLSLIFGVTRIVNFAHGSLYMLGLYIAYSLTEWLAAQPGVGALGFWGGVLLAAQLVAVIGAVVEILLLASHLPGARTVPVAGDLCAGAGDQGCDTLRLGRGGFARVRVRPACRAPIELLGTSLPTNTACC
jgi:hypothetical protein